MLKCKPQTKYKMFVKKLAIAKTLARKLYKLFDSFILYLRNHKVELVDIQFTASDTNHSMINSNQIRL